MSRLLLAAPLLLTIGGGLMYHLAAKSIPRTFDPAAALIGVYATALAGSVLVYAALGPRSAPLRVSGLWHPTIAAVGLGALAIELGYLLIYRAAWPVSVASVIANGLVAILLVPLGAAVFGESISATRTLGILLCLAGISLLRR